MNNLTFGINGQDGANPGGDGVIRDLEFRIPATASILSRRRTFEPYVMAGGKRGKGGLNQWIKQNGRFVNMGGKNSVQV